VGQNLQDHVGSFLLSFLINESLTFDVSRDANPATLAQFMAKGEGPLSTTHLTAMTYFTSSQAVKWGEELWPDIQCMFGGISAPKVIIRPLAKAFSLHVDKFEKYMAEAIGKEGVAMLMSLGRPKSRGEVLLNPADPFGYPLVDPKYYSHPSDIKRMIEGTKYKIRRVRRVVTYKLNIFMCYMLRLVCKCSTNKCVPAGMHSDALQEEKLHANKTYIQKFKFGSKPKLHVSSSGALFFTLSRILCLKFE
jgi:choline dehydrogenase-like flavoprotein